MPNKQYFKPHGKRLLKRRVAHTITNEVGATSLQALPEAEFRAAVTELVRCGFFSIADVLSLDYAREEKDDGED